MSTPPLPPAVAAASPAIAYAVLRVDRRKAKAMAAIAAASGHQMRTKHTPNADPNGPAPLVMFLTAGKTPYQAAQHLLADAERRNRDTVLCREIVLSASPSYFRPGREEVAGAYELDRVKAWASTTLAWAKRTWPDQLAAMTLHLDEQTPHAHLMVVPRVRAPDGTWKLNSKALFDRERLRELQTSYGEAVAPLGIRRGEPGSKATHTEVAQFYGAVKAAKAMPQRVPMPAAPKRPNPPESIGERLTEELALLVGIETDHQRSMKKYTEALAKWRERAKEAKTRDAKAWQMMQSIVAAQPIQKKTLTPRSTKNKPSGALSKTFRKPPPTIR
jgi:hypothetical protein